MIQIRRLLSLAGMFIVTTHLAVAGPTKIDVGVNPQKDVESKTHKNNTSKEVTTYQYSVKLSNRSFADVNGLTAEYRVFVRDDSGKGTVSQQKLKRNEFQATIPAIPNNGTYTFVTEPVKLESSQLDSNWVYTDGKRGKSQDKIAGVWIRIMQGGKIVGEYVNPSTIATKEKF
jgi:hypothetical protein